jgi:hypothetical protein
MESTRERKSTHIISTTVKQQKGTTVEGAATEDDLTTKVLVQEAAGLVNAAA